MNIIGEAEHNHYIVKINEMELKKLTNLTQYKFEVGDVIDIHKIYFVLSTLEENKNSIEKQAEQLRAIANLLEPLSIRDILKKEKGG